MGRPSEGEPRGSLTWALFAFGAAFSLAGSALAQEPTPVIRLAYRAPTNCPDRDAFVGRVRARVPRVRLVDGDQAGPAQVFSVVLRNGSPASGDVAIEDFKQSRSSRHVDADTCAEVVDALAMVVALTIDPNASVSSARPAAPPPVAVADATSGGTSPSVPMTSSAAVPAMSSPAPPAVNPPAANAPAAPSPSAPPAPSGSASPDSSEAPRSEAPAAPVLREGPTARRGAASVPRSELFIGLDGAADTGVSPNVLFGVSPYIGWQTRGVQRPAASLRLAFVREASGPIGPSSGNEAASMSPQASGSATFTWTVGRLDACPFGLPWEDFRIDLCARIEAGVLQVVASDIVAAKSSVRGWFGAGPLARAEWNFIPPVFLDAQVGATFRVTEDEFLFLPDTMIYKVPLLGVSASVGAGAHFL